MVMKSILLNGAVALVIIFSLTVVDSFEVCDLAKRAGESCSTCNFLTFGQNDIGFGFSYFCPNSNLEEKYCCYNVLRKPFCCNFTGYILNGFIWLVAVIAVISVIYKLIKCLLC